MPPAEDDLRFCRAMLPRVSRTFALNIRLLPGEFRDVVGLAYLLCRTADTLEDAWPGKPHEIGDRFALFTAGLGGDAGAADSLAAAAAAAVGPRPDELELLREYPRLLRVFRS